MREDVRSQVVGLRVRLAARLADKGALPRMRPHVRSQVAGRRERLAARLAHTGSLTRMRPDVQSQGAVLVERLATRLADEGSLPRMRHHVLCQVAGPREGFAARLADMPRHFDPALTRPMFSTCDGQRVMDNALFEKRARQTTRRGGTSPGARTSSAAPVTVGGHSNGSYHGLHRVHQPHQVMARPALGNSRSKLGTRGASPAHTSAPQPHPVTAQARSASPLRVPACITKRRVKSCKQREFTDYKTSMITD